MTEEARLARNAYMRQWKANNRDKVKRYRETYFQRLADKMKAESAEAKK